MRQSYYITLLACLGFTLAYGQVGINTNDPEQTLHVAGTTSNVRVDGLNATNNSENVGSSGTTRVFADANGDLVLGSAGQNVQMLVDTDNYLEDVENSDNIILQTGGGFGYNPAGIPVGGTGASFTLTGNAIVQINYSVSWSIYKTSASPSKRISDERARIVQTGVYLRQNNYLGAAVINDVDGVPINGGPWCIDINSAGTVCSEVGGLLGLNGQFYNNSNTKNGAYQNFHNTGSDYVKLGPGTYTVMFAGQLAVGDTSMTGAVRMYLGAGNDELQVIAYYYE